MILVHHNSFLCLPLLKSTTRNILYILLLFHSLVILKFLQRIFSKSNKRLALLLGTLLLTKRVVEEQCCMYAADIGADDNSRVSWSAAFFWRRLFFMRCSCVYPFWLEVLTRWRYHVSSEQQQSTAPHDVSSHNNEDDLSKKTKNPMINEVEELNLREK